MAWKATLTIASVDGDVLTAGPGAGTGDGDDSMLGLAQVTLTYAGGVPPHMVVGGTIDITGDC